MLKAGMISTFSINFLAAFLALALFIYLWRNISGGDNRRLLYAFIWLVSGGLWLFSGLRVLSVWLGELQLDKIFYYADQFFVFMLAVFALSYFTINYFSGGFWKKIFVATAAIELFGFIFLFIGGLEETGMTYFGTKYAPNTISYFIWIAAIAPAFLLSIVASLNLAKHWLLDKADAAKYEFAYAFILFAYMILGMLDEASLITGWLLVFFRLFYIVIFIAVYLVFQSEKEANRR